MDQRVKQVHQQAAQHYLQLVSVRDQFETKLFDLVKQHREMSSMISQQN
jgi:hypothetical protein